MTIHIALNGWQIAFIVVYFWGFSIMVLLGMMSFSRPSFWEAFCLAMLWPAVIVLAVLAFLFKICKDKFTDWINERKKNVHR